MDEIAGWANLTATEQEQVLAAAERQVRKREFYAAATTDPHTHLTMQMWTTAWAMGYEQALRDAAETLGDDPVPARPALEEHPGLAKSFSDRKQDAGNWLTARERQSEAALVTFALGLVNAERAQVDRVALFPDIGPERAQR